MGKLTSDVVTDGRNIPMMDERDELRARMRAHMDQVTAAERDRRADPDFEEKLLERLAVGERDLDDPDCPSEAQDLNDLLCLYNEAMVELWKLRVLIAAAVDAAGEGAPAGAMDEIQKRMVEYVTAVTTENAGRDDAPD